MRFFQRVVGEWAEETFKDSDRASHIKHLKEEVEELAKAKDFNNLKEECADILLIVFSLAHREGFDLEEVAMSKFHTCLHREWKTNEEGNVRHA